MFAYCFYISIEQLSHLLSVEPHRVLLHPYFQPDAAVGLVEDDFAVLCQRLVFFHTSFFLFCGCRIHVAKIQQKPLFVKGFA